MMLSHHRKRDNGDGLDRVSEKYPPAQVPQEPKKLNRWILQRPMRYQMKNSQPSAEQRGPSRRDERSTSRERTPPRSSLQSIAMIHHSREERKLLQRSNRMNHRRPRNASPLIQMKTMKNLEMTLELLHMLNQLYQYSLTILVMKTVSAVTQSRDSERILVLSRSLRSDKMKSIGQ